jgi:hypothetical protein
VKTLAPVAENEQDLDTIYEGARLHISKVCAAELAPIRISRIAYRYEGKRLIATVGANHPTTGKPVVAILFDEGQRLYYICTQARGLRYDGPILVGAWNVDAVEPPQTSGPAARPR